MAFQRRFQDPYFHFRALTLVRWLLLHIRCGKKYVWPHSDFVQLIWRSKNGLGTKILKCHRVPAKILVYLKIFIFILYILSRTAYKFVRREEVVPFVLLLHVTWSPFPQPCYGHGLHAGLYTRVQRFLQLGSPRPLMVAKLN